LISLKYELIVARRLINTLETSDEIFIFSLEPDEIFVSGLSAEQIHFAMDLRMDTGLFLKEICILAL
jgi:hypothetical protein